MIQFKINMCESTQFFRVKYFKHIHGAKLRTPNPKPFIQIPLSPEMEIANRHAQHGEQAALLETGQGRKPSCTEQNTEPFTQAIILHTYPKYTTNLSVSTLSTQKEQ